MEEMGARQLVLVEPKDEPMVLQGLTSLNKNRLVP